MYQAEIDTVIAHLWALYPRATERWPKARQTAFKSQLKPLHLSVEQVKAVCEDAAMNAKGTWCPPEAEILRRLRGVQEASNVQVRVAATHQRSEHQPGDRTVKEWTEWYLADSERQQDLDTTQLKGLNFLASSREKRLAKEEHSKRVGVAR